MKRVSPTHPRRVGLFGGAFDPVHTGHLRAALEVREALELDLLFLVPAGRPPHKNLPATAVSAAHRLSMLKAAVRPWTWMKVSDYELKKQGVSYTAETIRHFRDEFGPDAEYFLLVGSDWKNRIQGWKDYPYIRDNCKVVWFERSGRGSWFHRKSGLDIPVLGITSTLVRERLRQGRDVSLLVPDPVLSYIRRNRLYRT